MQTMRGVLLMGDRPQDIFLEEIFVMEKQKIECGLSVQLQLEYTAMANVTLKLIWIKFNDSDWFFPECPMRLYGDNKAAIYIAENDMFHEKIKHTEVDCDIIHKQLEEKIVVTKHVLSGHQLVDLLTKPLGGLG